MNRFFLTAIVIVACLIALAASYYLAISYIRYPTTTTANDTLYASMDYAKSYHNYNYYSLWVPTKVNGKSLWMMLDTGAWISFITSAHVHKLGLDILPQRTTMEFNHTAVKTVDVTMSVDGSHPFRTTVATAIGSFSSDVPLLSLLTS